MASEDKKLSSTEILNQFTVDEVILWLNAHNIENWFVCYGCNELIRDTPFELHISKWEDIGQFCDSCTLYCEECEEEYAPAMQYHHDDCKKR